MRHDSRHIGLHGRHKYIDIPLAGVGLPVGDIVHNLCKPVPCCKCAVDAIGRVAGRIQLMKFIAQHTAGLKPFLCTDFKDFISGGIQNHRRMIVVILHHMFNVRFPVARKINRVIIAYLALIPHVHKLIHDIDPQPVARLKKRL